MLAWRDKPRQTLTERSHRGKCVLGREGTMALNGVAISNNVIKRTEIEKHGGGQLS